MTIENENKELPEIDFFVLRGTLSDLSIFDFSCFGTKILELNSQEFKQFLDKYPSPIGNDHNWQPFKEILEPLDSFERIYVLFPENLFAQFSIDDLLLTFYVLLLLFPSDLKIYQIIYFQVLNQNQLNYCGRVDNGFLSTGENAYNDNYAFFDDHFKDEINKFINIFKPRYKRINYSKQALESYVSSFQASTLRQEFLDLCICLETIIEGSVEVSYRIKHHVSLLCAESEYQANIIFNNINRIYVLRSKIIHGEKTSDDKILEYTPYLRSLISRMIIEIILLNIPDRKKLDNLLTFAGFRMKPSLTEDYKRMTLNITSYVDTFTKSLR